ncbi:hypothetical protein RUM43_008880 [Polyplax serrata]|uniref:Uncharacterized protein n=1 Tax=Polyplax serrata TaxID=468196 RepID=A0AAN8S1M9_POLSC
MVVEPACSRASLSSISNASRRTRRSSRTSSAAGDCPTASRYSNRYTDVNDAKLKVRSGRYNSRLNTNPGKSEAKKVTKPHRPTFNSLQNTVVLAPFYTLKKCFQTKLLDLYSQERVKKLNKVKLAKKQNVSFEYDVLEVKKPFVARTISRKEAAKKKKLAAAKSKNKRETRSQSYCQCDKSTSKAAKQANKIYAQNLREQRCGLRSSRPQVQGTTVPPSTQMPLHIYDTQINTNKTNHTAIPPLTSENYRLGYTTKSNENLPVEGTSQSVSNVSSQVDSWETFSDSLSLREEHMEGSLALSTTSFDSCLEQTSKSALDASQGYKPYRYNTRYRDLGGVTQIGMEPPVEFPPTSQVDQSRHLIMSSDVKHSDDRITDFMDREPQSHGVDRTDIPENLHPLPHLSRTKRKKSPMEIIPSISNNYYLRSIRDVVTDTEEHRKQAAQNHEQGGLNHAMSPSTSQRVLNQTSRKQVSQNTNMAMSSATERNLESCWKNISNKQQQQPEKETRFILMPQTKTLEESSSQTEDVSAPHQSKMSYDINKVTTPQGQETGKHSGIVLRESHSGLMQQIKSNASAATQESPKRSQSKADNKPEERISKEEMRARDSFWNGNLPAIGTDEENGNDMQALPMVEEARYHSPLSTGVISRKPQDNVTNFIFGPKNSSVHLGESCKYPFGLNWVYSDEDDSNHGDRLY